MEEENIFYEIPESVLDEAVGITSEQETPTSSVVAENNTEAPAETSYNTNFIMDNTVRFSQAEWFDYISKTSVVLGGAGGIGSWLALLLFRANISYLYLYDPDYVDTTNLAGQFFKRSQVGFSKASSVWENITNFSDSYGINYWERPYDENSKINNIMMCGFDNMAARKCFFTNWLKGLTFYDKSDCLFLDGRLSAECLQVFCVQGDDEEAIKAYQEKYLFNDDQADATTCSYKQTSFMANMIAATMMNVFVNWCANRAGSFRPVPFFTEYNAVTMNYKFKINPDE